MNLTYVLTDTGYEILNNGVAWIVQNSYIPYPGETMEESAQNHINQILADNENPTPVNEIEALNNKLDNAILELTTLIAMGGM